MVENRRYWSILIFSCYDFSTTTEQFSDILDRNHSCKLGPKIMSLNCLLCDRSFDTQRGLNIHSKRSHRVDSAPELSITAETIDSQDDNINQCAETTFIWGEHSSVQFTQDLNFVYEKVVYRQKNIFRLTFGSAGKDFIR